MQVMIVCDELEEGLSARGVRGSGGGGKRVLEEGSQTSCKGRERGIGVGAWEALGARARNSCMRKRERESAIGL